MSTKSTPRINWVPNDDKPKRKRLSRAKKYGDDFKNAVINPKFVKVDGEINL